MDNFVSSVSKKTKMFNDSEGSDKYFTFRILCTGPNTNDFIRVRWMESIELDNYNPDSREQKYWQKKCIAILYRRNCKGLTRNNNLSYVPENHGKSPKSYLLQL